MYHVTVHKDFFDFFLFFVVIALQFNFKLIKRKITRQNIIKQMIKCTYVMY